MAKKSGGQLGNKSGRKGMLFRDALHKAIKRHPANETKQKTVLVKLCTKLLDEGLSGNLTAIKETADRLDGKPAQVIQGPEGKPITVIERIIIKAGD